MATRAQEARVRELGLTKERAELYDRLDQKIGNTPLTRLSAIKAPNRCRIYLKEEYKNPSGSHYDRQTIALLRRMEADGEIIPEKTTLWESTTGSSGASFAWMCRVLGYKAVVVIPEDMPQARIHQIKSYGAEVRLSPKTYIDGLVPYFRRQLAPEPRADNKPTNHSLDPDAWETMNPLAQEILQQFGKQEDGAAPNFLVTALGNGISARGVGVILSKRGTKLYGMEPYESPTVYYKFFPDRYKKKFKTEKPQFSSHIIYGTGPGERIVFPNIEAIAPQLEDVFHPGRDDVLLMRQRLMFEELQLVGNSSAACVWACLQLAEEKPNSTIVTILYDAAWRYLPFE